MKVIVAVVLALAPSGIHAARGRLSRQANGELERTSLYAELGSMVQAMIDGSGPASKDIASIAESKMDFGEAARQLDGKLPADVAALVRVASNKSTAEPIYDEASLQKARNILNHMMLSGWEELDNVIFECMGFRQRNRGTYAQVVADLARLGSQIARLGELKVQATEGKAEQDRMRKDAEELLDKETQEFKTRRMENQNEMTIRKNDLAVFDFILNLTSCDNLGGDGTELVQVPPTSSFKICNTAAGPDLLFDNPRLQAEVERLMTPDAKRSLRAALGQTQGNPSFVQESPESDDTTAISSFTTTTAFLKVAVQPQPVSDEPHPEGQWKKCVDGTPNCGLLHDLMSLEWGKFRDSFDELTAEMTENQDAFDTVKRNINDQLTVINDEKTKHMEALASATSCLNADNEESNEKEDQKRHLTEEYDKKCEQFRAAITEILHTKICAVRKVRNELLSYSSTTPPEQVSDCDFTDWHSRTGECIAETGKVIMCDDTCNVDVPYDQYDPFQCGGQETMKRDVVVASNDYGMSCPPHLLERKRRCAQKLCPVDCSVSEWSGWSKCSKDCEGGVESRTRSILVKPKNGGTVCDAGQEVRPCNSGSCDRQCQLAAWSDWAPCSMACGGGITTRTRAVLVPIRGQGTCPSKGSPWRFTEQTCNLHDCQGDEICIAEQDLIIVLDSSGSLRESGFEVLRAFAANLTKKYVKEYYGKPTVRIGVALFGNGKLLTLPDGTTSISNAICVQPLTDDFEKVRQKIMGTTWQRGFTNMAQGLTLADTMLNIGRSTAQSAVLVLSDGKYSFKYQTAEKAQELKDKSIMLFMAPVQDWADKSLETLKEWASQPWETNYERIPGLQALKYNNEIFAQKLMVKFCPASMSPSLTIDKEESLKFMLIHSDGFPNIACILGMHNLGATATAEDCYQRVLQVGKSWSMFSYGAKYGSTQCWGYDIHTTHDQFVEWKFHREHPALQCDNPAHFHSAPGTQTYAIDTGLSMGLA